MDVRSGNAGLVLEGPMTCLAILLDLLQNFFHNFCTNASELATSVHIHSSIFNNIYSGTVITEICTILKTQIVVYRLLTLCTLTDGVITSYRYKIFINYTCSWKAK